MAHDRPERGPSGGGCPNPLAKEWPAIRVEMSSDDALDGPGGPFHSFLVGLENGLTKLWEHRARPDVRPGRTYRLELKITELPPGKKGRSGS